MMKKVLIILGIIILGLGILFFLLFGYLKETDGKQFKEEYEALNNQKSKSGKIYPKLSIDENNIMTYVTIEEILSILEDGTGVIYFGFPECPWCRNMVPVLLNASNDTSIENIYYINMLEIRDTKELDKNNKIITTKKGQAGYDRLLKMLDSILDDYILEDSEGNTYNTNEKRIYVPLVVFVRNGEILDHHANTVDSQTDPYVELTDEEKDELYQIYSKGIHEVLNDLCDDKC